MAEFALQNGEFFSVLAETLAGRQYDRAALEKNWKLLLLNQFHDILPGSAIEKVYADSDRQFAELFSGLADIQEGALRSLCGKIALRNGKNGSENGSPYSIRTVSGRRGTVRLGGENAGDKRRALYGL